MQCLRNLFFNFKPMERGRAQTYLPAVYIRPYSYQHEQIDQFFALNFKNVQPSNNKQKFFSNFSSMFLNPDNFFQFEF